MCVNINFGVLLLSICWRLKLVLMRIPSCIDLLPCHLCVSHVLIFSLYVYLLNNCVISDFCYFCSIRNHRELKSAFELTAVDWCLMWWPVGFLKKWMWFSVNKLLLWFLFETIWMCVHTVRKVVTTSQYMTGIRVCLHSHIDTGRSQNEQVLLLNKRHYIYSKQDPILEQLVAGNTQ